MSGVTDCYQPAERVFRVTRGCVEVLTEFRNPFTIITKNHLVNRDLEIFKEMAERKAMGVFLSVTSLDTSLIEKLEPRTSRPAFRLKAIETLAEAGIPVGVMVAPVIPALTDHEIPEILKAVASAGAKHAGCVRRAVAFSVQALFPKRRFE